MPRSPYYNHLKGVVKRLDKLEKKLPAIASNIAVQEFKGNFRRGGFRTSKSSVAKWAKRKRDKSKRAILVGKGSGRLKRSLRGAPMRGYARVITNVPYAKIHNEGGNIKGEEHSLQRNARSGIIRWRKNGKQATMPQRAFMITTRPLMQDMEHKLFQELEYVFQGKRTKRS